MFELIGAYYRGEADFSFVVNTFVLLLFDTYLLFYLYIDIFNCLHRNMSRSIYTRIAYGMYSQGRFYAQVLSGYSYMQSKLTVE